MTVKVGNYYRYKTKAWLESKGFKVEYLERYNRFYKDGKMLMTKVDIFAADCLAANGKELLFVNSVFGEKNIARAIKKFLEYPVPRCPHIKQWVICWEKRKEPQIIEVTKDG